MIAAAADDSAVSTPGQPQPTTKANGSSNGTMGVSVAPVGPDPSSSSASSSPAQKQVASRTSSNSLKSAWKLKYQDFVPAKTGNRWSDSEDFQNLVDRANDWLRKNDDVRVRTCETITWMSHEQRWLGDSDQMLLSKTIAERTTNFFVRGLRLWLMPAAAAAAAAAAAVGPSAGGPGASHQARSSPATTATTIHCANIVPETKEAIGDLVEKINRKLKTKQLRGRILSVETLGVPIAEGRQASAAAAATRWEEAIDDDLPYAFVLRVFTDREAASRVNGCDSYVLGLRDVVPAPTEYGYESFEDLIEKSNSWMKDQSDVIITNMQSVMVQRNEDSLASMGSSCFYTMPGISSPEPVEFFRILRIAHLRLSGDRLTDLPVAYPFTYETFTPELVRLPPKDQSAAPLPPRERLEKMKETFSKVVAFLRNNGVDVLCSETVMNPMQMYIEETDTPSRAQHEEEHVRFLFTIRLFLTGQISHLVDGGSRMIKRASIQSGGGGGAGGGGGPFVAPETSDLLPSSVKLDDDASARTPLFLGSVVGRQFKYRWLVLGVSAVTCMTIIVALSVVYSNR